jgi:arginase
MLGARRIAVLDAPSNLGLRPPTATSVPGCAKAPGALRDHGLLTRLGARDAGCITPARYDPAGWQPGDGVAQSEDIAVFTKRLADRIGTLLAAAEFPLVLGGDCSILLGAGLALRRHETLVGGRIGLVYVDGHSDFRHQGNASYVGAAAGEALALATGRGQPNLAAIEHRRPYFRDVDVVLLGIRTHDEYRLDLQAAGIASRPVPELRSDGAARSAQWARNQLADCAAYWVHVDVDVLDPAVMPAVDAPDVGGIAYTELELLLQNLVATPKCLGVQLTVFDPDYDPDGVYARELTDTLVAGLSQLATPEPPPEAAGDPVAPVAANPAVAAPDPAVAKPVEVASEPVVLKPVEPKSIEPESVEPESVEPESVEPESVVAESVEVAEPVVARSVLAEPVVAKPVGGVSELDEVASGPAVSEPAEVVAKPVVVGPARIVVEPDAVASAPVVVEPAPVVVGPDAVASAPVVVEPAPVVVKPPEVVPEPEPPRILTEPEIQASDGAARGETATAPASDEVEHDLRDAGEAVSDMSVFGEAEPDQWASGEQPASDDPKIDAHAGEAAGPAAVRPGGLNPDRHTESAIVPAARTPIGDSVPEVQVGNP